MEAKELRIGNWVYVRTNGNNEQVKNIYEGFGSFLEPIPLTEEWLIKLGFKRKTHEKYGVIYDSENQNGTYINIDEYISYFMWDQYITSIKYVHQLQNLYFALNSKELEIKK